MVDLKTPIVTRAGGETGQLKGYSGVFHRKGNETPIEVLDFSHVLSVRGSREQIRTALERVWKDARLDDNDCDEVVFLDKRTNTLVVLMADELAGKVKPGDTVDIGGYNGEVVFVDDEWNEKAVAAGSIAALTGTALLLGGFGGFLVYDALTMYVSLSAGAGQAICGAGIALSGVPGAVVGTKGALDTINRENGRNAASGRAIGKIGTIPTDPLRSLVPPGRK